MVRLIAVFSADDLETGPPDRALVAAIERIIHAWQVVLASKVDRKRVMAVLASASDGASSPVLEDTNVNAAIETIRAAGPAAVRLLRELVRSDTIDEKGGEATAGGGLFLLTRALLDVKLEGLASAACVPFETLLGAVAIKLLGLEPPFDGPTALWVGRGTPDLAVLDAHYDQLMVLQEALLRLLIDQRTIGHADQVVMDGQPGLARLVGCTKATDLAIETVASLVVRAWTRWLPGLSASSAAFIVRNCLQRRGLVRASERAIEVQLDPAPLDVVVEMAGYFRPIDLVPWLNRRTIIFATLRKPGT